VIALGDLNGDGKLDIVTASNNVQDVSVLLGRGDGTFGPSVEYAVDQAPDFDRIHDIIGGGPKAFAVGDLNGDGKADVVVANRDAQTVSVLLGHGDGTLLPAVNYATGDSISDVAIGEFSRDGQLDILAAHPGGNTVSVLYGRGDGTFLAHQEITTGAGPRSFAVGDFDGDGTLDVATANTAYTTFGTPLSHTVSVLLNVPTRNERFIGEVYQQLLARPADLGALAYWSSFLDNGGSRRQMTLTVEESLEYRADEVRAIYERYLHRAPDSAGWQYFTQLLSDGGTVELVAVAVVGSDEYMQRVAPPPAVAGHPANDGFVQKLFQDALGRDADPASLDALDELLANHATHAQIAAIVFGSAEYAQELVQDVFRQFLGRDADPNGLKFETDAHLNGESDEQLIAAIAGSAEYFEKLGT